ncbi:hypothetical protein ONZ45_g19681 [Pleurotus djamor]|nr:hypothetical protein ONZ45_g19681 [Pleurotus djamor]
MGPPPAKKVLTATQRLRQREEASQLYKLQREGLTTEERVILDDIRGDREVEEAAPFVASETVDDDDDTLGDWEDVSQLSGDQVLAQSMRDIIVERWHGRHYIDGRTRRQRRQRAWTSWQPLILPMADAYLSWKYPPATNPPTPMGTSIPLSPLSSRPSSQSTPPVNSIPSASDPPISPAAEDLDFEIQIIDIFSLSTKAVIRRESHDSTAVALVRNGYIPPSPFSPSLVIATRTMELFRRLRLRKPSFSVEAFAKVLCDFYNTPYRYGVRNALAEAFDIYLLILREVDKQVQAALGRDSKDWRVLRSCPPCGYELKNEPSLKFRRMVVIDGNNSLKRVTRVGNRNTADTRQFNDAEYFLSPSYVDQFANEVSSRHEQPSDGEEEDQDSPRPDVVDAVVDTSACADNWKAAAASEKKKMWAIFDETGVFRRTSQVSPRDGVQDLRNSWY